MQAIKGELHCTTVMLIDTDLESLTDAARTALEEGLDVWVRPHLPDQRPPELLAHLREAAVRAEELRREYPNRVTLLVGSEFSLTSRGVVPGPRTFIRLQLILRWGRLFHGRVTRQLRPAHVEEPCEIGQVVEDGRPPRFRDHAGGRHGLHHRPGAARLGSRGPGRDQRRQLSWTVVRRARVERQRLTCERPQPPTAATEDDRSAVHEAFLGPLAGEEAGSVRGPGRPHRADRQVRWGCGSAARPVPSCARLPATARARCSARTCRWSPGSPERWTGDTHRLTVSRWRCRSTGPWPPRSWVSPARGARTPGRRSCLRRTPRPRRRPPRRGRNRRTARRRRGARSPAAGRARDPTRRGCSR